MSSPLRVGVAGLGTVGAAVLNVLARRHEELSQRNGRAIEVVAVCARDRNKSRGLDIDGLAWHDDPMALAQSADIDCLVELIGGEADPALAAVHAALAAGKHVVTANKAMLAHHGHQLAQAAEANGLALRFEAAVAGGVPIVKTLREGLAGNVVGRVYGILNGTCNYILSKMESEKLSFADCLEGGAAAGLRRGRSDLRHRRVRHGAQARDPDLALLRDDRRCRSRRHRRHRDDHARRSAGGRRSRLSRQAARRGAADCGRHRAERAADHGAERLGDRPDHGRDQRGRRQRRCDPRGDLGRPGSRGRGDGLRRRRRHLRHRPRRSRADLRQAGRNAEAPGACRDRRA